MKFHFRFLLAAGLTTLFSVNGSRAELCTDPLVAKTQELVDGQYDPKFKESCALKKAKSHRSTWRDSAALDPEIRDFTTNPTHQISFASAFDPSIASSIFPKPTAKIRAEMKKKFTAEMAARLADPQFQAELKKTALKKTCVSGVDFKLQPQDGFYSNSISEFGSAEKAISATRNDQKSVGVSSGSRTTACSEPIHMKSPLQAATSSESIDLDNNTFFENNKTDFSVSTEKTPSANLAKQLAREAKLTEQIATKLKSTRPGCTKKITSILVETASNSLQNHALGVGIGDWDFNKLSEKRADSLGKLIQSYIDKNPQAWSAKANKKEIGKDWSGDSGEGYAGPCAYLPETNSKTGITTARVISSEADFQKAKALGMIDDDNLKNFTDFRSALNTAKYGKITLETEESGPGCSGQVVAPDQEYFATKCFDIEISCIDQNLRAASP